MKQRTAIPLIGAILLVEALPGFAEETLENDLLRVGFDEQGIATLHDKSSNKTTNMEGSLPRCTA